MPFATRARHWAFFLLLALIPSAPALSAASPWFEYDQGAVRLVAAGATTGSAEKLGLGLEFRLNPGWKIYWRSPGDAGFPPVVNWSGSTNLAGAEMDWPAPERFSVLGLETVGYKHAVVLPISASLFEPGKAADLRARVRFLTCDDICVPYEVGLDLALPAGPAVSTPEAALIDAWRARVPVPATAGKETAPIVIEQAEVAGTGKDQALIVRVRGAAPFVHPDLFVEGPPEFAFAKPVTDIASSGNEALMRIAVAPRRPDLRLAGESVTLTLVDGDRAAERRIALSPAAATAGGLVSQTGSATTPYGFLVILGFALIGGLILNLMPCVLPVLSIKLLAVASHGGAAPGRIRAGFLASAAGIVTCFLLLGTVAVALKAAGHAVGWGVQFQQPMFLAFMISVLTLFACNMWGLFEIRLPDTLADVAATAGGGHGFRGHFLAGAFATLLATPCTAPFLGTAVGFALSRGAVEIYAVFLALGIGLALPWILVAGFPGLVARLPRPGAWMVTLKRILSFALVGTAAWLLSVLWFQIGGPATGMIALLMAAIGVAVWQYRHLGERARFATWIVVGLLTLISMVGAGSFAAYGPERRPTARDAVWQPFDLAAIPREVAAGRTVLVDVTADWCLTCQVNKSLVLNRGEVAALLGRRDIVAMKADWTRPDAAIAAYLKSFGRFGIPFNVVYGPAARQGLPLPELLTESSVLAAIRTAGGSKAR